MQISLAYPPNIEDIRKAFMPFDDSRTVYTYGNTLYNPKGIHLPADLIKHEETHAEQHKHDDTVAKLWWERYIADPAFRLSQEIEAYGNQYAYIDRTVRDRNQKSRMLWQLAIFLSSPMYGSVISHVRALDEIKKFGSKKNIRNPF